ncbi:MAG: TonB family protein [Saprospiraceae bacterium]|nr:TonB family protein [Saprospiraceae bacterium]
MLTEQSKPAPDLLEIVFADRNKTYGAYQLRRHYPAYLGRALGIGLLLVLFALALPIVLSAVSKAFPDTENTEVVVELGPPPKPEKAELPPPVPPPTPPPPAKATIRYVPPVVMIDNKVPEDDLTPAVDEILATKAPVGAQTKAGDIDGPPSIDPDPRDFGPVVETPTPKSNDQVYEFMDVNKMPSFQGGERDLLSYLAKHIKYPELARENNIQGQVVLSFVIDKDGSIEKVSVVKDIGGGCGKEAVRVVEGMPRWSPGEANGQAVKVRFMLPVRFKLD